MPDPRHVLLADTPTERALLTALDKAIKSVQKDTEVRFGDPVTDESGRTYSDLSGQGHTLALVKDPDIGRYVAVTGRKASAIVRTLAAALPAEARGDLAAKATDSRRPRDVLRLALAQSSKPARDTESVLVTALRSTDPDEIAAGIAAAALTDPGCFAGDLHRIATESADQNLRLRAERALQGGGSG